MGIRPDSEAGIDAAALNRVLRSRTAAELARLLARGARESKPFRQRTVALLIESFPEEIGEAAIRAEVGGWIDAVLDAGAAGLPRLPDLRGLSLVRRAVRGLPAVAVWAHMAVADGVLSWLQTYGGGPDTFYATLVRHFAWAAEALALLPDGAKREEWLGAMEDFTASTQDLGYGIAAACTAALGQTAARDPDSARDSPSMAARRRRRSGAGARRPTPGS